MKITKNETCEELGEPINGRSSELEEQEGLLHRSDTSAELDYSRSPSGSPLSEKSPYKMSRTEVANSRAS